MKNSQARTGHQRGMGGRWTDDDDTHERHTDTNRLTRHTASWLPHTLSWRTHNSRQRSPCRPPQHPRCQESNSSKQTQTSDRGERVRLEQACSASSNRAGRKAGQDRVWGHVRCLWTPSSEASCLRLALSRTLTGDDNPMYECMQAEARVLNLGRT